MKRLALSAEHRFKSRGLRRGDADRVRGLLRVELQHMRAGGSRGDRADCAGVVVPASVVTWLNKQADAARHFVAGNKGRDEIGAIRVSCLREREQPWQNRRARVTVQA